VSDATRRSCHGAVGLAFFCAVGAASPFLIVLALVLVLVWWW
jgi:hypothetical protein